MLDQFTEPPILIVAGAIACVVVYYLIRRKSDPVRKLRHEYFQRLWLWPPGSHTRWEAEVDVAIPGADKTVGFHSETTHEQIGADGPTDQEVAFCKQQLTHLEELFQLTKPAIAAAWKDWVREEMPSDWTTALSLDGFSVPRDGNVNNAWDVTWFCRPAGHYFCVELRNGKASLASVDG